MSPVIRRLGVRCLAFVVLMVGIDRGMGALLAHLFRGSPSDLRPAIAQHAPVAVLGSSRAKHHYVPGILQERLGLPTWNFGEDGQFGAAYPYAVTDLITHAYVPRLVVLDVSAPVFYSGRENYDVLDVLAPYVDESTAVRTTLARRSRWEAAKLQSRMYRYNSRLLTLLWQRAKPGNAATTVRGYEPLTTTIPAAALALGEPVRVGGQVAPDTAAGSVSAVDAEKVAYLRQMVQRLRAGGATIVAVRSPSLLRSPWALARDARYSEEMRRLLSPLGVELLDFTARTYPEFARPELYSDWTHMNATGATIFTTALADSLRRFVPTLAAAR